MWEREPLPASFIDKIRALEDSYLEYEDPIRQSGFGGGAERWQAERSPILDAIDSGGDILDVGCANGYLLECLIGWGRARGLELIPHGIDMNSKLVELARKRFPQFGGNFHIGNSWDWEPSRRYKYVYALHDCVPRSYLAEYIERLLRKVVQSDGRLIVGAYGSRSQGTPPFDLVAFLESLGYDLAGSAVGGLPPVALFTWIDRPPGVQKIVSPIKKL